MGSESTICNVYILYIHTCTHIHFYMYVFDEMVLNVPLINLMTTKIEKMDPFSIILAPVWVFFNFFCYFFLKNVNINLVLFFF